jgi:hypothetical protein
MAWDVSQSAVPGQLLRQLARNVLLLIIEWGNCQTKADGIILPATCRHPSTPGHQRD